MESSEIKTILQAALPGCDIQVQGDGRHFDLVIVGDVFAGARTLKRQQMVYGILNEHIASGALHAVNMKTLTPAEWQALRQ
jgi:acid stress-induced BolA-like protein IbaG/YrbA